jgi:hypothetical protein
MQKDTGSKCSVCKTGIVVAEVETTADTRIEDIPIGPGSSAYFSEKITSFHCSSLSCQVVFNHPPGNPGAGQLILRTLREEKEGADYARRQKQAMDEIKELARKNPEIRKLLRKSKPQTKRKRTASKQ